jgi:hypothetical protein
MSRQNKVNPDHYRLAGRLTPDEASRERVKQRLAAPTPHAAAARTRKPVPPSDRRAASKTRS